MTTNNWNVDIYKSSHSFVTSNGNNILELMNPQPNEVIIDLGCGNGELTNKIAKSALRVIGLDISPDMINEAKQNFPNITFIQHNGEDLFPLTEQADAVFSNASLNWMINAESVAKNIALCLKPGGRFVFEMAGVGHLAEIMNALDTVIKKLNLINIPELNYFPNISEYSGILELNGFQVKFAHVFPREIILKGNDGLRNWIKTFRNYVLNYLAPEDQDVFIKQVEDICKPMLFKNNNWHINSVRLRMVAIKV